ncbi:hypothetical protein SAMN05660766_0579 [Curtobacterium sp. 314Chir4.1]|nr:hypothetical protein SAMN05660766_0579 [Curtobacterium sp. 314Chir4.1]
MWLLRHVLILFCSSSVRLLAAARVLPGMHLTILGFLITIVVFAVTQSTLLVVARASAERSASWRPSGWFLPPSWLCSSPPQ